MTSFWEEARRVTGGAGCRVVCRGTAPCERLPDMFVRSKDYDLVQVDAGTPTAIEPRWCPPGRTGRRIGANQANPRKFFYDNLMMGPARIDVGRQRGSRNLYVGRHLRHPKFTSIPFKEATSGTDTPKKPMPPTVAKKMMLYSPGPIVNGWVQFNRVIPVNLCSPRDLRSGNVTRHSASIRKCVTEAGQAALTVWGDGSPTREFLYVEDAAEGILLAAERYEGNQPVNLGTGEEVTISNLATMIAAEAGFAGQINWDTSKPNGQPRRCLDVSRAKQLFGFQAEHTLQEGLKKTMQWFFTNSNELREVHF